MGVLTENSTRPRKLRYTQFDPVYFTPAWPTYCYALKLRSSATYHLPCATEHHHDFDHVSTPRAGALAAAIRRHVSKRAATGIVLPEMTSLYHGRLFDHRGASHGIIQSWKLRCLISIPMNYLGFFQLQSQMIRFPGGKADAPN